jgi:hypothetical protein
MYCYNCTTSSVESTLTNTTTNWPERSGWFSRKFR